MNPSHRNAHPARSAKAPEGTDPPATRGRSARKVDLPTHDKECPECGNCLESFCDGEHEAGCPNDDNLSEPRDPTGGAS